MHGTCSKRWCLCIGACVKTPCWDYMHIIHRPLAGLRRVRLSERCPTVYCLHFWHNLLCPGPSLCDVPANHWSQNTALAVRGISRMIGSRTRPLAVRGPSRMIGSRTSRISIWSMARSEASRSWPSKFLTTINGGYLRHVEHSLKIMDCNRIAIMIFESDAKVFLRHVEHSLKTSPQDQTSVT